MPRRSKAIGLGVLLLSASVAASFGAGVNLPTSRISFSPDLRWQVRCVTTKQSDGFQHTVYLTRTGTANDEAIWQATRSCDILWSEGGEALAITDWTGSSLSEIQIVDLPTAKTRRLDIYHVENWIPKEELEGHCYYEALRWEGCGRLQIRVFGHTDENPSRGFAYYFSVETESGKATLIRREDHEPTQWTQQPPPRATANLRVK